MYSRPDVRGLFCNFDVYSKTKRTVQTSHSNKVSYDESGGYKNAAIGLEVLSCLGDLSHRKREKREREKKSGDRR